MSLVRPIAGAVTRALTHPLTQPGAGGSAHSLTAQVQALFAKYSAVGGMWDFTSASTLSQDSAGTTPVTAASQPAGRANDLSGLGNHLIQATSASRPLYNGAGITFDGVDDTLYTASNVGITGDKVTLVMRYAITNPAWVRVAELGANVLGSKGVGHFIGYSASQDICAIGRTDDIRAAAYNLTQTLGDRIVACAFDAAATSEIVIRLNGTELALNYGYGDMGGGNFEPAVFRINNAVGGAPNFNGTVSRVVLIGAALTAGDLLLVEDWVGDMP